MLSTHWAKNDSGRKRSSRLCDTWCQRLEAIMYMINIFLFSFFFFIHEVSSTVTGCEIATPSYGLCYGNILTSAKWCHSSRLILSDISILADRLSVEERAWKGADDSAGLIVKWIAAKLPESWRMLLCKVYRTAQLYFFFLTSHH